MIRTVVCGICAATETYGQYGELGSPAAVADLIGLAGEEGWVQKSNGDWSCPDCVQYDEEIRFLGNKRLYDASEIGITSKGIEVAG